MTARMLASPGMRWYRWAIQPLVVLTSLVVAAYLLVATRLHLEQLPEMAGYAPELNSAWGCGITSSGSSRATSAARTCRLWAWRSGERKSDCSTNDTSCRRALPSVAAMLSPLQMYH